MLMTKTKKSRSGKLLGVVGLVLCVIFAFLLLCNLTIIIKGAIFPAKPPSVLGVTPMVVLSGSMSGETEDHIEAGDLIFVTKADPSALDVGDVIAFMDGSMAVTHRIIEVRTDDGGAPEWITKGDANDTADPFPVTEGNLIGIYVGRIPKLGDFALFLQTPAGMLIFLGIPLLAFILYDILRRQKLANKEKLRAAELEAELSRLRELTGEAEKTDSE